MARPDLRRDRRRALALVAALSTGCGAILYDPLLVEEAPARPAAAIVVLGIRPGLMPDGSVNPELARRMTRGLELFERGLAPKHLVTGGSIQPTDADVMRRIALEHGVAPSKIIFEPRALDTIGNARRSVGLLCLSRGPRRCRPEIILVTSPFHLARSARLFECAGARVQPFASEPGPEPEYETVWGIYEAGVRIRRAFDDACPQAAPRTSRFDAVIRDTRFSALDW